MALRQAKPVSCRGCHQQRGTPPLRRAPTSKTLVRPIEPSSTPTKSLRPIFSKTTPGSSTKYPSAMGSNSSRLCTELLEKLLGVLVRGVDVQRATRGHDCFFSPAQAGEDGGARLRNPRLARFDGVPAQERVDRGLGLPGRVLRTTEIVPGGTMTRIQLDSSLEFFASLVEVARFVERKTELIL